MADRVVIITGPLHGYLACLSDHVRGIRCGTRGKVNSSAEKDTLLTWPSWMPLSAPDFLLVEDAFIKPEDRKAEIHDELADDWTVLSGIAVFVVGTALVNKSPNPDAPGNDKEWIGDVVTCEMRHKLYPGDRIIIPKGVPHNHGCFSSYGVARFFLAKV